MSEHNRMACKGAPTIHHANGCMECQACGTTVAQGYEDHRIFGFAAGCELLEKEEPHDR